MWEKTIIDPSKIRRVLLPSFSTFRRKDVCLVGEKELIVISGKNGSILLQDILQKIGPKNVLVFDINGDKLEEILVIYKNRLRILGKNLFKEIQIGNRFKFANISLEDLKGVVYIYSSNVLKVVKIDGEKDVVYRSEKNWRIVDVLALSKNLYILTVNSSTRKGKIFEIEAKSRKILDIITFELTHIRFPNRLSIIKLGEKFYLHDGENLYYLEKEKGVKFVGKAKTILVGKFSTNLFDEILAIYDGKGLILRDNRFESIDLGHSIREKYVSGDIDGDGKDELIMVSGPRTVKIFDILLYKMGCEHSLNLDTVGLIIDVYVGDIDGDGISEILALTTKGIELIFFDVLIGDASIGYVLKEFSIFDKSRKHLILDKIVKLCSKYEIESGLRKAILSNLNGRKILVWEKVSTKAMKYSSLNRRKNQ